MKRNMVTATDNPDVLRVSFFEEYSDTRKTEIVCLIEATDDGMLKIKYEHHVFQDRVTGKGTWDQPRVLKMHVLDGGVVASIRANIMYQLFHAFFKTDERVGVGEIN